MQKRIALIPLLLMMILACKNEPNQDQVNKTPKPDSAMKLFSSDTAGFDISYPHQWEERLNGQRIGFFEPLMDSNDFFQENMVIWTEDMPLKISDSLYAKTATAELRIKNPNMVISNFPPKQLGSHTFYHFEFDFMNADSSSYKVMGYTTVHEKRGYNFSCASDPNQAKEHQQIFESMLSTFKPNK